MEKKDLVSGKTYTSSRTENDYFFVGLGPDGEAWFTKEGVELPCILHESIEFLREKRIPREFWRVSLIDFSTKENAEKHCYDCRIDTKHIIHYKEVIE